MAVARQGLLLLASIATPAGLASAQTPPPNLDIQADTGQTAALNQKILDANAAVTARNRAAVEQAEAAAKAFQAAQAAYARTLADSAAAKAEYERELGATNEQKRAYERDLAAWKATAQVKVPSPPTPPTPPAAPGHAPLHRQATTGSRIPD